MRKLISWKRIVLGVLGTIVLGAIGSGLWELAGKPATLRLGQLLLTGATLGSTAIKDSIYVEAAKGPHEATSLLILWLIVLVLTSVSSFSLGFLRSGRDVSKYSAELSAKLDGTDDEAKLVILTNERAASSKKLYRLKVFIVSVFIFSAFILLLSYLRLLQSNNTYTYFAQSFSICRPYLDDQQALMLESRFSAVEGRAEYLNVIDDLQRIAKAHNRKLPDFKPW
jgi:hypothetical protein